jgi:hypothetical protein
MRVMQGVRAAVFFFYRFVVGDDPTVAAVVLLSLVITGALVANGINAWWLAPPTAVVMTSVSLWRRRAALAR